MNLKRLPFYLLVMFLVSSLAACILPFNRPSPAPVPTLDNRVVMTLTAIAAKNQTTAVPQPTSQPTIMPTAVSLPPTWTPTALPGAATVTAVPIATQINASITGIPIFMPNNSAFLLTFIILRFGNRSSVPIGLSGVLSGIAAGTPKRSIA